MVLDNSNSPCHTEEELWLQVLSLSRELQDCKASLHHNTLDCISDKIEGIERELDVLLDILQGRYGGKNEACQYVVGLKMGDCFGFQSVMVE